MEYPSRVLIGEDEKGVRRAVRCDSKGYIYPADVSKAVFPLVIDFSKEWHKELVNADELGAEIVDLSAEGIPKPFELHAGKALKITVNAGETKYLRIPVTYGHQNLNILIYAYPTGTVYLESFGWMGATVYTKIPNEWNLIGVRNIQEGTYLYVRGGNDGGTIYIAHISIWKIGDEVGEWGFWSRNNVNQSLTTTQINYFPNFPIRGFAVVRIVASIQGDGTNPANVDIYIKTPDGMKQIASFSRVDTTPGDYLVTIPVVPGFWNDSAFMGTLQISAYGSGLLKHYDITVKELRDGVKYYVNGLKMASASNVSTTVTTYTLIDNNGRGNRYKNAVINISVPSTGGSAEILINGKSVATYSAGASATFNIPDDIDIWKIEVNLAGDGTNPATADFSGLELLGPYIVRR